MPEREEGVEERLHQDSGIGIPADDSHCQRLLLSALEATSLLQHLSPQSLQSLIKIQKQLCDSDSNSIHNAIQQKTASHEAGSLLSQVNRSLAAEWISEAQLLCQILTDAHIINLVRVYDALVQPDQQSQSRPNHDYYNVRPVSHCSRAKSRSSYLQDINPIYQSIESHLTTCHNHEYDVLDHEYDGDGSTLKTYESRFTVKFVQIIKGPEPLGITVQLVDEHGPVVVSRILYGGSVHRSGLVSAGDFIYEVNGIPLRGRTQKEILRLLETESHQESISFKLVVPDNQIRPCISHHYSNNNMVCKSELQQSGIFLKCHFDYNPCQDSQHPCPSVGLSFKKGDVLEVVSQEDDSWWQARHEDDMEYMSRAGVIPSVRLQEKRLAAVRDLTRQRYLNQKVEIIPCIKSPIRKAVWSHKVKKVMYNVNENEDFEENDLPTYEEVIHLYPSIGFCRPIVLFGSDLIGRRKIIRRLRNIDVDAYRTPIAHTTRCPRDWELDGAEYFFVSRDWFQQEEKAGNMIESEEYRGNVYGIHRETVRSIIASGGVCILSLQTQGLKAVRNPLFKPFVIFLKPDPQSLAQSVEHLVNEYEFSDVYDSSDHMDGKGPKMKLKRNHYKSLSQDEKYRLLHESSRLEYLYGHYFDVIIVVEDDMEQVLSQVIQVIRSVQLVPQWAPASWL